MQCVQEDSFVYMYNGLIFIFFFCIFSQFKFNGNLVSCEDDVIINGNEDECFIGYVEKLYEFEGSDDFNRVIIQWYFSYEELLILVKGRIIVYIVEFWRELFLFFSDSIYNYGVEDIDVEIILKKCIVLRFKLYDLLSDCLYSIDQKDLFYVRYKFDRYFNFYFVNKRVVLEFILKRESSIINYVKILKIFRMEFIRNQNFVKEINVSSNVKIS